METSRIFLELFDYTALKIRQNFSSNFFKKEISFTHVVVSQPVYLHSKPKLQPIYLYYQQFYHCNDSWKRWRVLSVKIASLSISHENKFIFNSARMRNSSRTTFLRAWENDMVSHPHIQPTRIDKLEQIFLKWNSLLVVAKLYYKTLNSPSTIKNAIAFARLRHAIYLVNYTVVMSLKYNTNH